MKTTISSLMLACLAFPAISLAQVPFDSGSDGSYGAMNITANTTLTMPEDGIFHCTTINIAGGRVLQFHPNARNTPVYLLAQGDVVISGTIRLNGSSATTTKGGQAGPGGWGGGNAPMVGNPHRGGGLGPGGSLHGNSATHAFSYGNKLLIPIVGGSGSKHGGGGAVLIASNTRLEISGGIVCLGVDDWTANERSSNGAIRLVSPVVEGSGLLQVFTPTALPSAGGRVRVDSTQRILWNPVVYGDYSAGFNMIVFPPNLPRVEIIEVADQAVDPNASEPLNQVLPEGTNPEQIVKVRVTNFNGTAKLQVRLTPENGDYINYELDIPNPGPGPAEGELTVTFPVNLMTRVDAWTRSP